MNIEELYQRFIDTGELYIGDSYREEFFTYLLSKGYYHTAIANNLEKILKFSKNWKGIKKSEEKHFCFSDSMDTIYFEEVNSLEILTKEKIKLVDNFIILPENYHYKINNNIVEIYAIRDNNN